jgi:hypothetical protein
MRIIVRNTSFDTCSVVLGRRTRLMRRWWRRLLLLVLVLIIVSRVSWVLRMGRRMIRSIWLITSLRGWWVVRRLLVARPNRT